MAKINTLTFKFGPHKGASAQTIEVPSVLVFVGPNESGKSLATVSIHEWYDGSHDKLEDKLFNDGTFKIFDSIESAQTFFAPLLAHPFHAEALSQPPLTLDLFCLETPFREKHWRGGTLSKLRIFPKPLDSSPIAGEVDMRPVTARNAVRDLHHLLLADRSRLDRVNQLIQDVTGFYAFVQLGGNGKLRIRFHPEPPPTDMPGIVLSPALQDYYAKGIPVQLFGDGLRSFIQLVLSVFPFEHKIVFLDEPELHLHPPLANRVAQELVREINRRDGQLIVSTHSPDFVAGCIAATDDIAMVRMTFSKSTEIGTARAVTKGHLDPFVNNRVVRNTDALNGIFHHCTVVVEGAFDKIAYTEFNRTLQQDKAKGVRDAHFVSAGSYAQVLGVMDALRKTGTPAAGILDFDVLYQKSDFWNEDKLLGLEMPRSDQTRFLELFQFAHRELDKKLAHLEKGDRKVQLRKGLNLLDGTARPTVQELLNQLLNFGLVVLPQGNLESLLAETIQMNRTRDSSKDQILQEAMTMLATGSYSISIESSHPLQNIWSILDRIGTWARSRVT